MSEQNTLTARVSRNLLESISFDDGKNNQEYRMLSRKIINNIVLDK